MRGTREMKNKWFFLIIIGMALGELLLSLRMLNPVLKDELVYYVCHGYATAYFILMGIGSLGIGFIGYAVLTIINYYYKRKEAQEK